MQFSSPPRSPSPRRSPNLSRSLANSAMQSSPNSPVRRNTPQFGTIPSLEPMTPIEPLNSPSPHSSESEDSFGEDETRLIIQNLVLINYKSYAGRQEVGPFNDSFTAVVGPNGSGKSNVIDSLLFVFGFRAKKMRQDKLSGLIHKSEAHPDLNFARVEVHFATKNVPNSELVVAREVRKDNTNFYTLNGKRSSYNDVAKLLESRGIDLKHKRFLILQGEVESIALMPPKAEGEGDDGLLEYLEDIIGTSNYKVAIKDLEDQGDGLRVDSGEKQRRLDIVAKDLRNLDSGRQQIERFMATSNSLNSNKSKLWQLQSYKLQAAANINQESLTEAQTKLQSLQTQFADHNREINELNAEVEAKFNERKQLTQQSKSNSQELKKLQTAKTRFDQMASQLETKRRKLERDLNHSKFTLRESQNWLANFAQDSQQWNSKLAELKTTAANEQTILDSIEADLHEKTKDLHTELDDLQAQAAPFRDQIFEKSQLIKNLHTEITQIEAKLDAAISEESECVKAAEQLISEGKASKRKVNEFSATVESLTNEQTTTKESLTSATQRKDDVLGQIAKLKPEIRNAKDAKTRTQTRNRIESELMQLKITGLYGRLGSLGQIDQKYDIAVSTAGPELNNFVVDTVDTAKKCVDELRKRNLGRAKFMVLDKLNPNYTKDGQSLPAPRLLDLVTPIDQSFFKAFASVLGDTLVVSTSDEASKVAFGGPRRHKVVTLDGILVNSSGQMSGGGRPMRGLMSKSIHSVSNEELENMEKQLASLEYDSADLHSEMYRLNTRLSELEQEIPKSKTNLEKEQLTLSNLEAQMMSIREKRRDLKKNVEQCNAQVTDQTTQSNTAISELQTEQDSLEQQSKTVESAIKTIQDRILEIGGAKLREQRSKMSNLQIQIESLDTQVNNGNALEAQHQSKIKKLESEIQQFEDQLNDNEQPDNQFSEADSQRLVQLENDAAALNGNIKSLDAQIATTKQQVADISSGIESAKTEEIALSNEIDSLGNELKANEAQIQELRRKHDSIQMYDLHTARDLMADQQAEEEIREKEQDEVEQQEAQKQELGEHSLHDVDESLMETDPPELDNNDEAMDSDSDSALDADMTATNAGIYELSPDELMELDERSLKDTIQRLDRQAKEFKVNFEILDLYNQKFAEYMERKAVSDEALALYNKNLDDLKKNKHRRLKEFMTGFNQISSKLKEMYRLITIGGNAELELIDSLDPFTEGISFSVMPPRKSWRNISNLSGGEKTLSSLALVFALHHYKPTPLYVMDEIDAALDYRNVSIIANYIKERTKNGQFIVISLRNNMFELATRLVGVYKINNMTRSVAMQIE